MQNCHCERLYGHHVVDIIAASTTHLLISFVQIVLLLRIFLFKNGIHHFEQLGPRFKKVRFAIHFEKLKVFRKA